MTKNNFFVITGGPGAGKTSLLENLVSQRYICIPETARQIIKGRLARGLTPRPEPNTFAKEIFDKDWANFISNSILFSPVFFDRSFMDSALMLFDADTDSFDQIKDILSNRYNNKVFI